MVILILLSFIFGINFCYSTFAMSCNLWLAMVLLSLSSRNHCLLHEVRHTTMVSPSQAGGHGSP